MANVAVAQPLQQQVWQAWASSSTTMPTTQFISNTATTVVWANWNDAWSIGTTSAITIGPAVAWAGWNTTWEETAEQRAAREVRDAEAVQRQDEAKAERQAALKRSEELLEFVLTDEQMADYRERGYFEVTSEQGPALADPGTRPGRERGPDAGDGQRAGRHLLHPPARRA